MNGTINSILARAPENLFDTFVEELKIEYEAADERSKRHPNAQMRYQHLRRAQVEAGDIALQNICQRFGNIRIGKTLHDSHCFAHAILPHCTVSVSRKPRQNAKLRKAHFRGNLAFSNQHFLSPALVPQWTELPYMLICHGPLPENLALLGFVELCLPISSDEIAEKEILFHASLPNLAPYTQKQYMDAAVPVLKPEILSTEANPTVLIEQDFPEAKPRLKNQAQPKVG